MRAVTVFVLAGIGTYLARALFVLTVGQRRLSEPVELAIRNVGPAVLAALTTSLLVTDGVGDFVSDPAEVAATAVAVFLALRTRSYLVVLIGGMVVLWGLRLVL